MFKILLTNGRTIDEISNLVVGDKITTLYSKPKTAVIKSMTQVKCSHYRICTYRCDHKRKHLHNDSCGEYTGCPYGNSKCIPTETKVIRYLCIDTLATSCIAHDIKGNLVIQEY